MMTRSRLLTMGAVVASRILGKKRYQRLLVSLASNGIVDAMNCASSIVKRTGKNFLEAAYNSVGVLNYDDNGASGELNLVSRILPEIIDATHPLFFDVGANKGDYALMLRDAFPKARIYAFEPNPNAYEILKNRTRNADVECVPAGCSETPRAGVLYIRSHCPETSHAATCRAILEELHAAKDVEACPIRMTSLDAYCHERQIPNIDFVKIDVEGDELSVLQGARGLLGAGKINIIQFEFNEMNVLGRIFLRDFYRLLSGYRFFRLLPNRLLDLKTYNPRHEIFQYQNILAVPFHKAGLCDQYT